MRYRLGSFVPRAGSSDFAHLLHDSRFSAPMTRALEEMLRVRLSRPSTEGRSDDHSPDLLSALEPGHPDRAWVHETHERLLELEAGGLRWRLLACEYESGADGFLTLAGSAPERTIHVFPGDPMQMGFAAQRDAGIPVRVWPRLLREVCANGSLVCFSELGEQTGGRGIGDAIERCLSPAAYETTVRELRAAREITVEAPRARLDELQRVLLPGELAESTLDLVESRFLDDDDDTLYGLFNAVTATARDLPDWRDRLDLEELAGHLARLRPPVPSRSGGRTLVPA